MTELKETTTSDNKNYSRNTAEKLCAVVEQLNDEDVSFTKKVAFQDNIPKYMAETKEENVAATSWEWLGSSFQKCFLCGDELTMDLVDDSQHWTSGSSGSSYWSEKNYDSVQFEKPGFQLLNDDTMIDDDTKKNRGKSDVRKAWDMSTGLLEKIVKTKKIKDPDTSKKIETKKTKNRKEQIDESKVLQKGWAMSSKSLNVTKGRSRSSGGEVPVVDEDDKSLRYQAELARQKEDYERELRALKNELSKAKLKQNGNSDTLSVLIEHKQKEITYLKKAWALSNSFGCEIKGGTTSFGRGIEPLKARIGTQEELGSVRCTR